MMEWLAQFGVATAELFEAEGRSLRRNLIRVMIAIGFALLLLVLGLAGLGFLLFGVYLRLAEIMPPPDAAVVLGAAALIFAAAGAAVIRWMF
jgi:hypothetical protein